MELWNNVLACIEKRISHQNFDIWFKPTSLHEQDLNHNKLFVRVPNKHFKYWLAENYAETIAEALAEMDLGQYQVSFVVEDDPGGGAESDKSLVAALTEPCQDATQCNLNSIYTFRPLCCGL